MEMVRTRKDSRLRTTFFTGNQTYAETYSRNSVVTVTSHTLTRE